MLDGALSVRCGSFDARPGSFVSLPRGLQHRFRAQDQAVRLLLITVPDGIEDYFGQINNAAGSEERYQIGEQYRIFVVPE